MSYCKFCIYTHPVNSKFTIWHIQKPDNDSPPGKFFVIWRANGNFTGPEQRNRRIALSSGPHYLIGKIISILLIPSWIIINSMPLGFYIHKNCVHTQNLVMYSSFSLYPQSEPRLSQIKNNDHNAFTMWSVYFIVTRMYRNKSKRFDVEFISRVRQIFFLYFQCEILWIFFSVFPQGKTNSFWSYHFFSCFLRLKL